MSISILNMDYQDQDDGDIISEGAEYSPKSEFSKPIQVSDAVRACIQARGKQMRAGYVNTKISTDGSVYQDKIDDTRQVYIGCVRALRLLLSPEINGEDDDVRKQIKNKIKEFEEAEKDLWNKYSYKDFRFKLNPSGVWIIEYTSAAFMPELDEELKTTYTSHGEFNYKKGTWNTYVNTYWNEMVKLYDEVFSILNILIDHLKYFRMRINF